VTSAYPGGIDSFTNPNSGNNLNDVGVVHADQHANVNDAVEAIETELGTNPKGGSASVAARLSSLVPKADVPLNLRDYATGDGSTDDTAGVQAWVAACVSQGRSGFAPAGTYMVTPDTVVATLSGITLTGANDRKTIFKARSAGTRLLDFRQSGLANLANFAVDGNSLAQVGIDLGNTTVGASTGNYLFRVRPLNHLDKGIDLTNNGDTVADTIHGGPWPDTATGIYWPNQGGNNLLRDPKLFPTSANPGPGRAAVEASFQNMDVVGGALMGLRVLDNSSSQTLRVAGTQFYGIKDGGNIIGPLAGAGLYALEIGGATKLATATATQCYFDGAFQFIIAATAATFNSGATNGTPNAFGASFSANNGTTKLRIAINGCVLRNESGAAQATWNEPASNVEVDYRTFFGASTRNYTGVVRAGNGTSGTGLVVGGGATLKTMLSSPLTPSAWATDQAVTSGTYISTTTTMSGVTTGNGLIVEPGVALPAGVRVTANISGSNAVRLTVYNNSGSTYTLPGGTAFRVYALIL
jgi:hypothetical protein